MKKIVIFGLGGLMIICAAFLLIGGNEDAGPALKEVEVTRQSIAEKALAVGTIEPDKEIKVKSTISGIISEVYFKVGDKVEKNQSLFKITPNPTPLEYVETRRNMEIAEVTMKQLRLQRDRKLSLFKDSLIAKSEMDAIESQFNETNLKYKIARERFQLLQKGRIKLAGRNINSIIKSPINGVILSQNAYEGDPVVPLTNFQPGTEMCAMANMSEMLFKGTVDEIDVGKLEAGMQAEIQVGALPDTKVPGKLMRIAPKAKNSGNATLFDIEISVENNTGKTLRAGYSATAYIKIKEKVDTLVIPERLVIFEKDKRFVEVKQGEQIAKLEIKTGLSDSLNIEVLEGVKEGQKIIERPPREIK